ncbi:MAG TPA: hypothetical protein GXX75_21200 [Clostridiales bacterium]|nr:hypothetical protein [Clostridiales bacterium]
MRGEVTRELFSCVPEIDFNSGNRYFLGNMGNYTKALLSTLKSVKAKLPILRNMHYTGEYEGLRMVIQTLRKMLGNIGALSLAEEAYRLETTLVNEDLLVIKGQLEDFIIHLTNLAGNLEALLKLTDVTGEVGTKEEGKSFLKYDFTKTRESIRRSKDLLDRKIM